VKERFAYEEHHDSVHGEAEKSARDDPGRSALPGFHGVETTRNAERYLPGGRDVTCDSGAPNLERPEESSMQVKRIVADFKVKDPSVAQHFYHGVLGLDVLMDMGWIVTYGSNESMSVQINFMMEGGSGTQVPDLSIEVDDLEAVLARVKNAQIPIEYGPATEPWGVRRFFVRDPFGRLVNILAHER
jgi:catechol 2,3-dioxygenase-like lactoylglutathione lyase family enzyme